MQQTGIFKGRTQVKYPYACYGYTRNSGKTWHGGIDLVGLDDTTVLMPFYKGQAVQGKVLRARIVTDKTNKTWEWGYYVCVQLDKAMPDGSRYLYLAHNSKLLVKAGQRVCSGDALAVMGHTGNAAGSYDHVHLEVRKTATGKGIDPTHYSGTDNATGVYGSAQDDVWATNGPWRIAMATGRDKAALRALCEEKGLTVTATT